MIIKNRLVVGGSILVLELGFIFSTINRVGPIIIGFMILFPVLAFVFALKERKNVFELQSILSGFYVFQMIAFTVTLLVSMPKGSDVTQMITMTVLFNVVVGAVYLMDMFLNRMNLKKKMLFVGKLFLNGMLLGLYAMVVLFLIDSSGLYVI